MTNQTTSSNNNIGLSSPTISLLENSQDDFKAKLALEKRFPDRLGIILAAGAATRFRPLTASRLNSERGELVNKEHYSVVSWNKASLPIANRPLIGYTIDDMVDSGFRYIVVNVSKLHSADSVINAALSSARIGDDVALTFLVEERPSGTYGGVTKMLSMVNAMRPIPEATDIAVFSGDIYTEQPGFEILRYHREKRSAFTLMLNQIPDNMKNEFGTVELDDQERIVRFHEKEIDSPTNLNNSSRYIAQYALLNRWAKQVTPVPADKKVHSDPSFFFDFGLHLFGRHLEDIKSVGLYGFVSERQWADLGRISDFHSINMYILKQRMVSRIFPGASIDEDCSISGNYSIKNNSSIRKGSVLEDVSIGEGWIVDGAKMTRTVLMPLPQGLVYTIGNGVELVDCVIGCGNISSSYSGKVIVFNGHELVVNDI